MSLPKIKFETRIQTIGQRADSNLEFMVTLPRVLSNSQRANSMIKTCTSLTTSVDQYPMIPSTTQDSKENLI